MQTDTISEEEEIQIKGKSAENLIKLQKTQLSKKYLRRQSTMEDLVDNKKMERL